MQPYRLEALRLSIDELLLAELLEEAAELSLGRRALFEVHKMDSRPSFLEKTQRFSHVGVVVHPEDLNVHGSKVCAVLLGRGSRSNEPLPSRAG